jgi:hypothetical protein
MITEATDIKNRAGALVNEASGLIARAKPKYKGTGHPLPDASTAIKSAMEAQHYAGMVLLNDLPRDRELAERCFIVAKTNIAAAEKALAAAKAALARM